MDHLDHIRKPNFAMTFLVNQSKLIEIFTFDLSYIICLINDICLIDVEIGLITIAGPLRPLLETLTLSTNGWSYCFIQREKGVSSYYLTLASPFD